MKIKKVLAIMMVAMSVLVLASCGSSDTEENIEAAEPVELVVPDEPETEEPAEAEEPVEETEEEQETSEQEDAEEASGETTGEQETKDEPAIPWDDITKLEEPVTMYAQSRMNVRKGPDTAFDSIGMLSVNDAVQVIGTCNSSPWKEINYQNGIAFVHGDYLSTEQVDLEAQQAAVEAAEQAAAEAAQNQQQNTAEQAQAPKPEEPAPAPQPEVPEPAGILFIGDSRTCQMQTATQGAGCSWICEYGTKYEWFENTAIPKADKLVGQGTKVVICMGVNDPGSRNNYASLANRKAGDWNARGAAVYFVSLNPTAQPYEDKNTAIDNFNASMPGLLSGVHWIDTASTVKQGGYVLVDGIHYDAASNVNIFNLIRGNL